MVSMMYEEGLIDEKPPAGKYLCANLDCTAEYVRGKLSVCAGCHSVKYCARACQVSHWKSGHKRDCKRLAVERKARLEANPHRMGRIDSKLTQQEE
mmetsp:Transcript_17672/g.29247  ORF Transcript_17672/g.29247 Transcript_17672/m.29247 type:complete len:96 (-) Transcript_17672:85-372(-)